MSVPEYFQKRMQSILAGVEGTVNVIDETLVYGKDQAEHDELTSSHSTLPKAVDEIQLQHCPNCT